MVSPVVADLLNTPVPTAVVPITIRIEALLTPSIGKVCVSFDERVKPLGNLVKLDAPWVTPDNAFSAMC